MQISLDTDGIESYLDDPTVNEHQFSFSDCSLYFVLHPSADGLICCMHDKDDDSFDPVAKAKDAAAVFDVLESYQVLDAFVGSFADLGILIGRHDLFVVCHTDEL